VKPARIGELLAQVTVNAEMAQAGEGN
jgi:hypothetical protein